MPTSVSFTVVNVLFIAVYPFLHSDATPQHNNNPHLFNADKQFCDDERSRSCAIPRSCKKPLDCEDVLEMGNTKSGVYNIWPQNKIMNGRYIQIYCDMETDTGGWTVIQRRGNFLRPKDYFYKYWADYKNGFGDIERDFWLGNDNIFALTNQKLYSIRFDLTDVEGNFRYALYDTFFIDDENRKYNLTIQDYSGTANDSMIEWHAGGKFSTKDQDNDLHEENCAEKFKGGWWYKSCHASNLNGLYLRGKHAMDGVVWALWKGHYESMDKTEMKIRSKNFRRTMTQQLKIFVHGPTMQTDIFDY